VGRGTRKNKKLPRDSGQVFFEFPKISGMKRLDAHEESIGGANVQICKIAVVKPPLEFNPAFDDRHGCPGRQEDFQFLPADRFKARCGCGKKLPFSTDHMPFYPFSKQRLSCRSGHFFFISFYFLPNTSRYLLSVTLKSRINIKPQLSESRGLSASARMPHIRGIKGVPVARTDR